MKRTPVIIKPAGISVDSEVFCGDVRDVLDSMDAESVHCAISSPPYWGLRDYHSDPKVWGGDVDCQHEWGEKLPEHHKGQVPQSSSNESVSEGQNAGAGQFCQKCGAWYGQLGLEPNPELFTAHIVQICRKVKRVLRDDGTLWLNLGDSYYGGKGASNYAFQTRRASKSQHSDYHNILSEKGQIRPQDAPHPILKPKDLVGIPWRVALALQADGWWLRNDVIWHKVNAMPSSVKDRLTNAHEHVFLLTKKAKYFYDADAISEDAKYAEQHARKAISWGHKKSRTNKNNIEKYQAIGVENNRTCLPGGKRNKRDTWTIPTRPGQWEFCYGCHSVYEGKDRRKIIKDGRTKTCPNCGSTDKWVEHFAMFPSDLVSPCILAGTSAAGCCPKCGSPWRRVVEKTGGRDWRNDRMKSKGIPGELAGDGSYKRGQSMEPLNNVKISTTICWEPSCSCFSKGDEPLPDPVPCTVLDPFSGAGTTGVVAAMNGRRFIGIDVKEEYAALSRARVEKVAVKHSLEVTSPFQ